MGLSFLAPLFLAGLAALTIPILVHLTHRQKATVVPFPSLMFVQKVPFKSMRRQKIRHVLLFALRCLAIMLLVFAFSRPFLDTASATATLAAANREVVILVDISHSMSYGERWQRAQQAARDVVGGLSASDRASLVFFADAAQLAVRSTPEPSVLLGSLEALSPTNRGTRYAPAIGIAQQLLAESDMPAKEVVLITDYQRAGFDSEQQVQLPEGARLVGIDVAEEASSNLSIATLLLQREAAEQGEQFVVNARLVNQGEDAVEDVPVTLHIGGEEVETRTVTLDANAASTLQFEPRPLGNAALRGAVTAGSDALAGDNTFYFMINPGETLDVLVLENPSAHDTDSFFLERALSVGTRPAFRVQARAVTQLQASDLQGIDVVVLNDAPYPSGGAGSALRAWVEAGGGVVVALGELVRPGGWQGNDATALVPPFAVNPVDRNADLGGSIASYDRNHAVFEVFRTPRSGDFTAASFYRYWSLDAAEGDLALAGFDDGSPALLERGLGTGRVLVWPSSLDVFWNDLPRQPVFVPFAHRLIQHAAGYREAAAWHTVGGGVRLAALQDVQIEEGTSVSVAAPDGGSSELVAADLSAGTADPAAVTDRLELAAPGYYSLAWSDDAGDHTVALAANLDRNESDLSKLDPEELAAALSYRGGAAGELAATQVTAADREASQAWWWYLLLLVFVLLAAETFLSNRLSPSSATRAA
jgi:hypothetical protein